MHSFPRPPILEREYYNETPVFRPENLLREARRQRNLQECEVPEICVLDPDGDLADYLVERGDATVNACWAGYHSTLYSFELHQTEIGLVPRAVGAPFAVLVAEQLFVSGCRLLLSVTSAGIITEPPVPAQFTLITEAVRDEGTSYHYLPADRPARLTPHLHQQLASDDNPITPPWFEGVSWTTDAPYRETPSAIAAMKKKQVTCVEMEAAALYAFGEATGQNIICFAHLTNTMAQSEGDFEKGEGGGSVATLRVLSAVLKNVQG